MKTIFLLTSIFFSLSANAFSNNKVQIFNCENLSKKYFSPNQYNQGMYFDELETTLMITFQNTSLEASKLNYTGSLTALDGSLLKEVSETNSTIITGVGPGVLVLSVIKEGADRQTVFQCSLTGAQG